MVICRTIPPICLACCKNCPLMIWFAASGPNGWTMPCGDFLRQWLPGLEGGSLGWVFKITGGNRGVLSAHSCSRCLLLMEYIGFCLFWLKARGRECWKYQLIITGVRLVDLSTAFGTGWDEGCATWQQ